MTHQELMEIMIWILFICMAIAVALILASNAINDEKEKEKDEGFRNRVRGVSPKPVSKHVMGRSNAHRHNRLSNEQAGTKNHSKEEKR